MIDQNHGYFNCKISLQVAKIYFQDNEEGQSLEWCDYALSLIDDDNEALTLKGDLFFAMEEWYNARE